MFKLDFTIGQNHEAHMWDVDQGSNTIMLPSGVLDNGLGG